MNKKEKFENFLESLKGNEQNELIEVVKKGFHNCFEAIITKKISFDDLMKQLYVPLKESSGDFIEDIANQILPTQNKVKHLGDGFTFSQTVKIK